MSLVLYLQRDSDDSTKLKSQMTDDMWKQVKVEYSEEGTYLVLSDDSKINEVDAIVTHLSKAPSLSKKIANAQTAARKAYRHAVETGVVQASTTDIEARRKICSGCPFSQKRFFGSTCMKCGCNIKLKTSVLTESCPISKW